MEEAKKDIFIFMKLACYYRDRNTETKREEAKKYIQFVPKYTKFKNKNYKPDA